MRSTSISLLLSLFLAGCVSQQTTSQAEPPARSQTLVEARRGFKTTLLPQKRGKEPMPTAPSRIFRTLKYPAPSGQLGAYLSPNPGDGKKHPAIIWITGGDCNSIGDVWTAEGRDNDQSAAAYRKAGIVMMFPSLRGGNNNPGVKEGFLGEVNDVLAATNYLEKQPYVDPRRIYLGGHSTGGTLVLLVAECSKRFRDVFSFGPIAKVSNYGADSGFLPFDITNAREVKLRSPGYWLDSIQSPVWVLEGTQEPSNIRSLQILAKISTNSHAHFVSITGATHFNDLAPTNELIARKILQDTGAVTNVTISEDEVSRNFAR